MDREEEIRDFMKQLTELWLNKPQLRFGQMLRGFVFTVDGVVGEGVAPLDTQMYYERDELIALTIKNQNFLDNQSKSGTNPKEEP